MAGSPDGRQENTISTRTRLAAGLCALSVALLFGGLGEPVATADTETGDAVSGTQGVGGQGEEPGTTETDPTEGTLGETGGDAGGLIGPMALGGRPTARRPRRQ